MQQKRKGLQSTQMPTQTNNPTPPSLPTELSPLPQCTHNISATIIPTFTNKRTYNNLTGKYLVQSAHGYHYALIIYHDNANTIFAESLKDRKKKTPFLAPTEKFINSSLTTSPGSWQWDLRAATTISQQKWDRCAARASAYASTKLSGIRHPKLEGPLYCHPGNMWLTVPSTVVVMAHPPCQSNLEPNAHVADSTKTIRICHADRCIWLQLHTPCPCCHPCSHSQKPKQQGTWQDHRVERGTLDQPSTIICVTLAMSLAPAVLASPTQSSFPKITNIHALAYKKKLYVQCKI